jgi:hypothetical protein
MYYQGSVEAVIAAYQKAFPHVEPKFIDLDEIDLTKPVDPSYVLWMCQKIKHEKPNSYESAVKMGRWIGWIFREVELRGLWPNSYSRDLSRADKQAGRDLPHQ